MQIIDTIPYFKQNYHSSIEFLRNYYGEYPEIFKEYFAYHCKDTEERHLASLEKYPGVLSDIDLVYKNIVPIIHGTAEHYKNNYQVSFPADINLIVGGFGSNAYTYRQIIPNITFALEKLSPVQDHLKTIVAHEFGHAAHNIISNNAGIDWKNVDWNSPLTWLYQEGAATHFSRQTAKGIKESVYFSFDDEGEKWLQFFSKNQEKIISDFARDVTTETPIAVFKEWFSITGGAKFGYNRLGYLIGDQFFQELIKRNGELVAIVAWKDTSYKENVINWLLNTHKV
ncbi:hypothetical protein ABE41_005925 [Fictibacillus arsenicus]|uniref:Aminopeptidase n=1 Tax=Fictibacillus arsenicus TaxID=255247 RepID=A0A1B1Z2K2_9BACL|nr:hypothetical protein [Fictibacillus arsenicus]ANX11539.1 hypothetical protein ABE41_005925 [Fictibacillus arsenicus]